MTLAPVLLLAFNRPDLTAQVLAAIQAADRSAERPLFVALDGPRGMADEPGCAAVHSLIAEISWTSVTMLAQPRNLGCRAGVQAGIDWFFAQVERGIVLEDDTVPDPSFFPFVDELLERFTDDERVMMISGDDFTSRAFSRPMPGDLDAPSYWFGRYAHIWGWATWRRAWSLDDPGMSQWPSLRRTGWLRDLGGSQFARYWRAAFDGVTDGRIDTWDYAWQYSIWRAGGLVISPHGNLVTNLGFRADATHTRDGSAWQAALPTTPMSFPLHHATTVHEDVERTAWTEREVFGLTGGRPWRGLTARLRRGR